MSPKSCSPLLRLRRISFRCVARQRRRVWVFGLGCLLGAVPAVAADAPPVSAAGVDLRGRPSLGSAAAAVTVLEIASFRCGHCAEFHRATFPALRERYIDSGQVRWVVLNASDDPADQHAKVYAVARALHQRGRYWANLDLLFQIGRRSSSYVDRALAQIPDLDPPALAAEAGGFAVRQAVGGDFRQVAELKLPGTPIFIIAKTSADGRRTEARVIGAETLANFRRTLEAVLQAP